MKKKEIIKQENGEIRIITDCKYRDVLYYEQLTEKERKKVDNYFSDILDNYTDCSYFRFKGNWYLLEDFFKIESYDPLSKSVNQWQGYSSENYFSGIVIKYDVNDFNGVIVGTYYS